MADIRAELRSKTKVHASIRQATGAAGTKQHSQLSGRDVPDQHPMTAITGLVSALAKKSDGMEITVEGLVYLTSDGERIAGPYKLFSPGDGEHSGPAYVASDEPPEDTDALWIDTTPPEEAVALGVTAVETAEGVDLHCTDELGTTKVTVLNGRDGAQGPRGDAGPAGPAGPQGAPGDDYVLTDEDKREIAGIAAGMVPGGGGGDWTLLFDGTIEVTEPVRRINVSLLASCEGMTEIFATGSWTANANTESGNDNAQLVIGRYSTNQGGLGDMSHNQNFAVRFSRAGDYEFVEILKNPNSLAANNSSITGVVDTLNKPENSNCDNLSIHPFAMTYQGTITLTVTGR